MVDQCAVVAAKLAGRTRDEFLADENLYDATVMRLFTIGEDANGLSEAVRLRAPGVEWHQIRGLRNVIAHGYYEIAPERIWKTAAEVLPSFRAAIERLLEQLP